MRLFVGRPRSFAVLLVLGLLAACIGTTKALPPQAVAKFNDYPADTFPQTSFHTAKVCDVVAVRVDFTPALPAGTRAKIRVEEFGGAEAELGQVTPPLKSFEQDAAADGSLGFGFHFISGRPGTGSADIVIEVPGRPVQRITVRVI